MNSFDVRGVWWLPEEKDKRFAGTLRYTAHDGGHLTLTGLFPDETRFRAEQIEIVLGVADNRPYTLYSCFTSPSLKNPGPSETNVHIGTILVGRHFDSLEQITFKEFSARWDLLDAWLGKTGFSLEPVTVGERLNAFSLHYSHLSLPEVEADGATIAFSPTLTLNSSGRVRWSLAQEMHIRIRAQNTLPLSHFFKVYLGQIANFLSLGLGRQVTLTSLLGRASLDEKEEPVRICYRIGREPSEKQPHPNEILFTYDSLPLGFSEALSRWLSREKLLKPTFDLYFSSLDSTKHYVESRFLALCQALEAYQSRTDNSKILEGREAEVVVERLNSALADLSLPKDVMQSLEHKLKYINEPSLRRRIRRLVDGLGEDASLLFGKPAEFAAQVAGWRNYLTHYDSAVEGEYKEVDRLIPIADKAAALVELCLLREIGFSRDSLARIAREHSRFDEIRHAPLTPPA